MERAVRGSQSDQQGCALQFPLDIQRNPLRNPTVPHRIDWLPFLVTIAFRFSTRDFRRVLRACGETRLKAHVQPGTTEAIEIVDATSVAFLRPVNATEQQLRAMYLRLQPRPRSCNPEAHILRYSLTGFRKQFPAHPRKRSRHRTEAVVR